MNVVSAKEIFEKNRRFDLIYKILFIEHINDEEPIYSYYKSLYLKSIATFNNFYEEEPKKESDIDFIESFITTYKQICENGYNNEYPVPVNNELQLYDGAHRLSIATVFNLDIPIEYMEHSDIFDYKFFKKRKIDNDLADIGALEYVKHNNYAHIVQVFPVVDSKMDSFIEGVLEQHGFIYYKKEFPISYNGIVRIKRVNYGSENWAGNRGNDFAGLKSHALNCLGLHKMRVYVFVCESTEKARLAKTIIREKLNSGNFPIHINDRHEEALELANIYFNRNAIDWINSGKYSIDFDEIADEVIKYCEDNQIPLDDLCVSSSSVINIYGMRKADDIDCICKSKYRIVDYGRISSHLSENKYYSKPFDELVTNYNDNFVLHGVKFLSMHQLRLFKSHRHEWPKDFKDLYLILIRRRLNKGFNYINTALYYIPKGFVLRLRK